MVSQIPSYLEVYIAQQNPMLYTPMDHASWRFVLKVSRAFFAKHAHQKYLDGLQETGIGVERIPLIQEMDQCLRKFGWRAVAVSGFIPPAVFMEFLSLEVLPIACDMRQLQNLGYTPAPDIIHEAAGHAPIIADLEYRNYLKSYGEISRKAISSSQDMEVYEAVRHLSEVKEDPESTQEQIDAAQKRLNLATQNVSYDSEAALLARMGWWTFEYGLIGSMSAPKIYGAGLLSSLSESYHCLEPKIKKIPFSVECVKTTYDITRPQPQLFVCSDFKTLAKTLQDLGDKMAFRVGGMEGLEKALRSQLVTTTTLDTGVQMSGILENIIKQKEAGSTERPCYLQFRGPTQLCYNDQELEGQGAGYHREGFGTPLEKITDQTLQKAGLREGTKGQLAFSSGVRVEGTLTNVLRKDGKIILLTFDSCQVSHGKKILFRPEWGKYDMACGEKPVSVFGGAADRKRYLETTGGFHQEPGKQKSNLTEENRELNLLYQRVRDIREQLKPAQIESSRGKLMEVYEELKRKGSQDWLLRYELLELSRTFQVKLPGEAQLEADLLQIAKTSPSLKETIFRGLDLIGTPQEN